MISSFFSTYSLSSSIFSWTCSIFLSKSCFLFSSSNSLRSKAFSWSLAFLSYSCRLFIYSLIFSSAFLRALIFSSLISICSSAYSFRSSAASSLFFSCRYSSWACLIFSSRLSLFYINIWFDLSSS